MKAAVLTQFRQPLEMLTMPDPQPGPEDAVLEVACCGICRSDWHAWQEDWTWFGMKIKPPHILGHEISGRVIEVGKNVRSYKVGDRATAAFHTACGHCFACSTGHSNQCTSGSGSIGFSFQGGFAQYVSIPQADINLVRLPDAVDDMSAAALGCRFMTAYHGVIERAAVQAGEWVAVFGLGGVGLSVLQIAVAAGAQVIAVDISDDKLQAAQAEGAAVTINGKSGAAHKEIKALTKGGVNVSVDALGIAETALPAIGSLRRGGRHLQIGMTSQKEQGKIALPVDSMVQQELSFIGTYGCPVTSYPRLLSLVASGKLNPKRLVKDTVSLDQTSDVLTAMTTYSTMCLSVINRW